MKKANISYPLFFAIELRSTSEHTYKPLSLKDSIDYAKKYDFGWDYPGELIMHAAIARRNGLEMTKEQWYANSTAYRSYLRRIQ